MCSRCGEEGQRLTCGGGGPWGIFFFGGEGGISTGYLVRVVHISREDVKRLSNPLRGCDTYGYL